MFQHHAMPPLVALGLGLCALAALAVLLALAAPLAAGAFIYGLFYRGRQLFNFLRRLARRAFS